MYLYEFVHGCSISPTHIDIHAGFLHILLFELSGTLSNELPSLVALASVHQGIRDIHSGTGTPRSQR